MREPGHFVWQADFEGPRRTYLGGQLFREVLEKKLAMRDSRSAEPQVGQVGFFSSRSRIVIVTENSFWHFVQRNS